MTELLLSGDEGARAPIPLRGRTAGPAAGGRVYTIDDLIAEADDLRPLPEIARCLLAIAEDDDFSLQDLAIVVGADQALSAKILRIANSPFHRHARQVGTVRDAVVLLGFRTVRSAALAACVTQSTPARTNYLDYTDFWRFSVAVGLLAEMIAGRDREVREMAFTAGVLHSLGRLALDQSAPAALARAVETARENGLSLTEAERTILGFSEEQLGGALALHWGYPPDLVEAIALDDLSESQSAGPLAAVVRQARRIALSARLPHGLPELPGGDADAALQPALDAPPTVLRELMAIGGVDALRARVEALLDGVLPDGMSAAA